MNDEDVEDFFHHMQSKGFQHVALIGGEPYVRPKLLRRIVGIIPSNWLITSGTSPLIRFDKTTHIISIDGKDAETHDRIRKSPGLFNRIIKNIGDAKAKWREDFPAIGHSVLNAQNFRQIGEILDFWRSNQLLDGITFSIATPIESSNDENLRMNPDQWMWIKHELMKQKARFGDYLLMSNAMISHFDPSRMRMQRPDMCRTAKIPSFAANGDRISKCVLSPKADCSACGCVITGMVDGICNANLQTIRTLNQMITT
jgi:sulfatase maturation enzyme AslB (radical SAM superfamily)